MHITTEWLGEWLAGSLDAAELAETLTTAGLEVDSVSAVAGELRRRRCRRDRKRRVASAGGSPEAL